MEISQSSTQKIKFNKQMEISQSSTQKIKFNKQMEYCIISVKNPA